MPNPTKLVINCETGVQEEIELTDEEVAQLEADRVKAEADKAAADKAAALKAKAKTDLLKKLGITQEEADLLLA